MDTLRREDIRPLLETRDGPCISIYIPTGRAGVETLQNPIRFKNQVREAERRLEEMALRPADVRNMTAPMRALVEDYYFWQHQAAGMAAFRSPDYFGHFRLPVACEERAVVTGRFHLKPLLRIFAWDSRFWVLAVSRNSVRLLDCTRFQAREAPLPEDMPKKLADVVPETDVEPHLQVRSAGQRGAGGRTGAFHQHGGALEEPKEDLARYFREIDRGLRALLRDERAPLVFAGTDYYFPIYRSVNTYAHLAPEAVPASAEGMRAEELHQRALPVVQPLFDQEEKKAAAEFRARAAEGRGSGDLAEIVAAAHHRRVDVLFVALGLERWGRFDPASSALELHGRPEPGDADLLDLAATQTILHGGTVFPVEPRRVPDGKPAAAVFRY
jgi:hypothetical protein